MSGIRNDLYAEETDTLSLCIIFISIMDMKEGLHMKISEHLYKTSGVEYETNSNTFLLECKEGLILFDLGYEEKQWNVMKSVETFWGLNGKKTKAFLTHGHYDHAGNTYRVNEEGVEVWCGDPDATKIENGYPEMEKLFGRKWICANVDHRLEDGQRFEFGNASVEVYSAPGHSKGSFAFVVNVDGHRALITGDMFYTRPLPPQDDVDMELAYMGGEDFDLDDFIATLEKMSTLHCDILCPGHYYVYYGDVDSLCRRALAMARQEKKG